MKEVIGFIKYSWNSWENWQKAIIFSLVLNVGSVVVPMPYALWMTIVGWSLMLGYFAYWWVTSMLLPKWTKYKEHRNQLLTTIKESSK